MKRNAQGEVVLATRRSQLARWQARAVMDHLQQAYPDRSYRIQPISTQGDEALDRSLPEIGGKGVFTFELEEALREGQVDLAVHSLKDLPTEESRGLRLGAVLLREDPRDALVAPEPVDLHGLPMRARVGTSSPRRKAQALSIRPDLQVEAIRGNVETRLRKVMRGEYDAALMAAAGLQRLGLESHISAYLPLSTMLPAPGQGALAVQCRTGDDRILELLEAITDAEVHKAVQAERTFLQVLGGGCSAPLGAYASIQDGKLRLRTVVLAVDGSRHIDMQVSGKDPYTLGREAAERALSRGALELITHA
jgi:hydroxymethylbilane synthase